MSRSIQWIFITLMSATACLDAGAAPTLTTFVTFNGANGASPRASLIADADGNLYGTTFNGGPAGGGTVFRLDAGTRALSTLATFNPYDYSGANPLGRLLLDAAGNLYGVKSQSWGSVFQIEPATNAVTVLTQFYNTNTADPIGGIVRDSSGNLYGTTYTGGQGQYGTVFQITVSTNEVSYIAAFGGGNGAYPEGDLIADGNGNLYGTTHGNGADNEGTVFEIAADTHALSTLATFTGSNGAFPSAGLVADAQGNLYGATSYGGANNFYGTVFEVSADTHTFTTLANFDSTGGSPTRDLILDAAGNLYGTASTGGKYGDGTVFKVDANTHIITMLATFDGGNGADPIGGLIADPEGNLYGTTAFGGANGDGTIFELTDTGFVVPEPAGLSLILFVTLLLIGRVHQANSTRLRRNPIL